jgi:hypothetical protein
MLLFDEAKDFGFILTEGHRTASFPVRLGSALAPAAQYG